MKIFNKRHKYIVQWRQDYLKMWMWSPNFRYTFLRKNKALKHVFKMLYSKDNKSSWRIVEWDTKLNQFKVIFNFCLDNTELNEWNLDRLTQEEIKKRY